MMHQFKVVCDTPAGQSVQVEHLPDLFSMSNIDDSAPHVHTFYEILWFQEGEGIHTIDFQEYRVKPNTIFFITPGQVHNFDANTQYKGISIKICTDLMNEEHGQSNLFLKYNIFHNSDTTPYYIINEETARDLMPLVASIERELMSAGSFGHIDILRSLLKIFLVRIYREGFHDGKTHLDELKPSHRIFVQFRKAVETNFYTMHTVQEYAELLHVAIRTLNKSVYECSGKTPLVFINDRITLEAKRMIRHTNMMVKEIAYSLGFEDPSYFFKFFKRQTGYVALEFREREKVCASCFPQEKA